ncbi:MAG: FMN-binding protein [Myxococcota bacterium]
MRALLVTILLLPAAAAAQTARAEAALKALFPDAERFTPRDVFLTEEMAARLEKLARVKVTERMVTFYVAARGETTLGYAALHTHRVRTKNETLAIGFEPDGRLKRIDVAVFLEPEEYLPTPKWLAQFAGKTAEDRLGLGDDVSVLSGATLSARSISETARWLLQALRAAGPTVKPALDAGARAP